MEDLKKNKKVRVVLSMIMKIAIITAATAVLLTGCDKSIGKGMVEYNTENESHEAADIVRTRVDGRYIIIDRNNKTITDGEYVYTYSISKEGTYIYYPNGYYYNKTMVGSFGYGIGYGFEMDKIIKENENWQRDFEKIRQEILREYKENYIHGDMLIYALEKEYEKDNVKDNERNISITGDKLFVFLIMIFFVGCGIYILKHPEFAFGRWRYDKVELSKRGKTLSTALVICYFIVAFLMFLYLLVNILG